MGVRPRCFVRFALAFFLAASAAAQPSGPAFARLAAGDSVGAHDAARAALRRAPDDVDLRRLVLRLRVDGPGVRGLPRPIRDEQILDAARALLSRAPSDTLALRVLAEDHVWTALGWHDQVTLGHIQNEYGTFVDPAEVRARQASTVFDDAHRQRLAPDLDRSARARDAALEGGALIETWLEADAGAPRAYALAATFAVLEADWPRLDALARRFGAASDDPRAALYLGLARYRLGDATGSQAAFDRALEAVPPAARARFEDVRPLLPEGARDAYDADPSGTADAFWAGADPRLLTPANERRAEHRARVLEADLLFGRSADDRFQPAAGPGAETSQGRVWVRYGRPDASVRFTTDGNAVQVYGERDLRVAVWDYPDFRFAFDDPMNSGEYRTYSPPARAFAATSSADRDDFVAQDRRMQRDDPQRTQDAPAVALEVPALLSRFRSPRGADVVVAWGVPLGVSQTPVTTGAFVLEGGAPTERTVRDYDALESLPRTRSGGGRAQGGVWPEAAALEVAPGGAVRVEVQALGGRAWGARTLPVEPLAASGFGVSDLLLATAVDDGGRGPVVRGGVGIVPAAVASFPAGDPVWVYLEVYDLALERGRSRYTVEAELRPVARRGGLVGRVFGRGQGPGVSVRTEAQGDRATEPVAFFVDVSDQPPGDYTLRVEVRDEGTGATAASSRPVVLE